MRLLQKKRWSLTQRKDGDRVGREIGRKEHREGKGWEEEDV
jgi:hypothetical protein